MVTVGILPFRKNSHGRAGNRPRDLVISSQRLWPLDQEADHLKTMFENRRGFVIFILYSRTDDFVSRLHELPKINWTEINRQGLLHLYFKEYHVLRHSVTDFGITCTTLLPSGCRFWSVQNGMEKRRRNTGPRMLHRVVWYIKGLQYATSNRQQYLISYVPYSVH